MGANSKIEWTDHTFNPWRGCTKVSAGCANCYAETKSKRNPGTLAVWGPKGTRVLASESMWRQPLKWQEARHDYVGFLNQDQYGRADPIHFTMDDVRHERVFCASLADVFEEWHGDVVNAKGEPLRISADGRITTDIDWTHALTLGDARRRLFALIDQTPNLDWLLLTKRPENIRAMWCSHVNTDGSPPSMLHRTNVWLGTSVENQDATQRVADLRKCRDLALVLFLSVEPLLGPIELDLTDIDWVIVGGESGPNSRPMHPMWARDIRDQCVAAGVPFLFKQWGNWMPVFHGIDPNVGDPKCRIQAVHHWEDGESAWNVGKKAAGRLLDGREWNQFPGVSSDNY